MTLTAQQIELRRTGIGGSEIAAVVGQDPYRTPLDIWLSKVEGWEVEDSPALERGRFLEAGVADWYAHRTGSTLMEPGTIQHPASRVALCTPDRIARTFHETTLEMVNIDVSIKVPGPYVREQWGERGTEDVPRSYMLQLQWEMGILSARGMPHAGVGHLAAPIDGDLRIYPIPEDPELFGLLLAEAEKFWRDHVERKEPPPLDGSDTAREWLARRFPRDNRPILKADVAAEVSAVELWEADQLLAEAEKRRELACQTLKEIIGDAAGLEGAFGKITWRANKNGVRSFRTRWAR